MSDVIEISDLHKAYGRQPVLRGLNLRVRSGEAFGLVGPNGSGKSTLIHLMLGFLRPDRGRISLLGSGDLDRMRLRVGYVPERQRYHTRYTAREYLRFLGTFSGMHRFDLRERVDQELATVGLSEVADRSLSTFSKGMLQRFGVAQALLSDPDLLLIDEPTSGLDPAGQHEVLDLLNQVRVRGHTLFLCTHYLQEVDLLCDRVGVLAGGQIAAEVAVRDLRTAAGSVRIQTGGVDPALAIRLERLDAGVRCDGALVRISRNRPELQAAVLRTLLDAGVVIIALEPLERPLEQLYQQAVQRMTAPVAPPNSWAFGLPPVNTPERPPSSTTDPLLKDLLERTQPEAAEAALPERGEPQDAGGQP